MNFLSIVGARPQLIKAAAVSREIRRDHTECLLHTGQHYDEGMSGRFFAELPLPVPDINLGVGSGSHGAQTGTMLAGIEIAIREHRPDWVVVYGDTNSTMAGALAAAKLNVPVAHIEAGLRSFNRRMPEEINRVVTDHLSTALFCPTDTARLNLAAEGITEGVIVAGDVMIDSLNLVREAVVDLHPAGPYDMAPKAFVVATIHRAENTDDLDRLRAILAGLGDLSLPVLLPLHPRTQKVISDADLPVSPRITTCSPLGYGEMIALVRDARVVVTDSGGVQKEAHWLGTPCVTVRDQTEWVETVESGRNLLTGADARRIVDAVAHFVAEGVLPKQRPPAAGTSRRIVAALEAWPGRAA